MLLCSIAGVSFDLLLDKIIAVNSYMYKSKDKSLHFPTHAHTDSITEHQMLPFEEYFLENVMSNSRATSPEL